MTVRVFNIGSGSSGNALLIRDATSSLLVDCGMGPRSIEATLRSQGLHWNSINGLVVSHEHSDHIKALPAAVRHNVSIFCTEGTARGARLAPHQFRLIEEAGSGLGAGLSVRPLVISHDALEPCGFEIQIGQSRICVITDTGQALDHFLEPIRSAHLLILESNHDERMLRTGPYPRFLKERVASTIGHLSNAAAGELLREALKTSDSAPIVWLGHLSETNNRPEIALKTVREQLGPLANDVPLAVLSRYGGERWASDAEPCIITRTPRDKQLSMFDPG